MMNICSSAPDQTLNFNYANQPARISICYKVLFFRLPDEYEVCYGTLCIPISESLTSHMRQSYHQIQFQDHQHKTKTTLN